MCVYGYHIQIDKSQISLNKKITAACSPDTQQSSGQSEAAQHASTVFTFCTDLDHVHELFSQGLETGFYSLRERLPEFQE